MCLKLMNIKTIMVKKINKETCFWKSCLGLWCYVVVDYDSTFVFEVLHKLPSSLSDVLGKTVIYNNKQPLLEFRLKVNWILWSVMNIEYLLLIFLKKWDHVICRGEHCSMIKLYMRFIRKQLEMKMICRLTRQ